MELTPGVIVVIVVVVVGLFVILRGRRHEAAAPNEMRHVRAAAPERPAFPSREADALVAWLLDRAAEQIGMRVDDDPLARQRITEAAATAQEELDGVGEASISLPFLTADASGPKHFAVTFTRTGTTTFQQR
jgi:hypothetical protein